MRKKLAVPKHVPFFDLRTPADLFEKMREDLERLEKTQDARDAFNFFVTAEHMLDWLEMPKSFRNQHAVLGIVSDVACGAKHFKLTDSSHVFVTGAEQKVDIVQSDEPGFVDVYVQLRLQLDDAGRREFGAATIDADYLGRKVLEFWEPYVALHMKKPYKSMV